MELVTLLYSTGGSETATTTTYTFTKAYNVAYALYMTLHDVDRGGYLTAFTQGEGSETLYSFQWNGRSQGSGGSRHNCIGITRIVRYDNVEIGKEVSMTDTMGGGHFILIYGQP